MKASIRGPSKEVEAANDLKMKVIPEEGAVGGKEEVTADPVKIVDDDIERRIMKIVQSMAMPTPAPPAPAPTMTLPKGEVYVVHPDFERPAYIEFIENNGWSCRGLDLAGMKVYRCG